MREETIITLLFTGMGVILVFVSSSFILPSTSLITGAAALAIKSNSGIILTILMSLAIIGFILVVLGLRGTLNKNKFTATAFVSTGDPLTDYITYAKSSKKSHYTIKSELMGIGWTEEEIDKRL